GNNETNTAQTIRVLNNSLILIPELEKQYNAALSSEQRYHETQPYHRKHKTQRWNEKCHALGICLKRFVKLHFTAPE
ncbi:hypothetical protein, partial [Vibrio vulnificus]|uniref:hypothetical protein n=1 Tax=Vibrio vulnificus TaxID=672 RepID=UPI003ED8E365